MSEMFPIQTEGVLHTKCKGAAASKLSGVSRFCIIERSFTTSIDNRDILLSIYGSLHYAQRTVSPVPSIYAKISSNVFHNCRIRLGLSNPINYGHFHRFNRAKLGRV